jgi:outer membrane protein OmpA-like peptidoglycan-associated protein
MRRARWAAVLAAALIVAACGPKQVRSPDRPIRDLVVLLPESDGHVGAASVSNASGSVDLDGAREATRISPNAPPTPPTVMSETNVKALFGDVLAMLPPEPRHFTLYFRFESEDLTAESRALVPDILRAVKTFPAPDVLVVGHTDTTGQPTANIELGLRRANVVRKLLLEAGLEGSFIDVTSHGEADLLVPTADNVLEARNRRVEITVR